MTETLIKYALKVVIFAKISVLISFFLNHIHKLTKPLTINRRRFNIYVLNQQRIILAAK